MVKYVCNRCSHETNKKSIIDNHINRLNKCIGAIINSEDLYNRLDDKQIKKYKKIQQLFAHKKCQLITSFEEFIELDKKVEALRDMIITYKTKCNHINTINIRFFKDNYVLCKYCKIYEKYVERFRIKNCLLLTSSEEFIKLRKTVDDFENIKVEYIATCNHKNNIVLSSFSIGCGLICKNCNGTKIKSTEEVIIDFKKVHGDRYMYDKVKYKQTDTKVEIGCKLHGYFEQAPHMHLRGDGCPECGGKKLKTTEKAIIDFKNIHEETYLYDKVHYINTATYIDIGCKIHGYFKQKSYCHLQGQGCPRCLFKNETLSITMLEEISGYKFNKTKPKFLNGMELDGYNSELNLAIEYNGEQHYKYIPHFHRNGIIDLKDRIEKDILKQELCTKNGVYLITVPYWIEDTSKFITAEFSKYELFTAYKI